MKRKWIMALALAAFLTSLLGASHSVLAAQKTMVIKIPGCLWSNSSVTVSSTVSKIPGVVSVDANPIAQNATVVFDDTKTTGDTLFTQIKTQLMKEGLQVIGKPEYK